MAKILIVEDDKSTILFLEPELKHEGYEIVTAQNGRQAIEVFEKEKVDLVLLDVMIPEINGFEVLRRIRKISETPVILVTARNDTLDKVTGLNIGADDYISKPFEIEELLARVNAVIRRFEAVNNLKTKNENELSNGEISLSVKNMSATVNGNQIQLSKTEFLMLKLFMENKGEVLTRERIIDEVWGKDYVIEQNSIDVYLSYLKNKIKKYSSSATNYFKNLRGVGFIMEEISKCQ